jgi:ABC-type transport system involved in cytochrome c biogenesis ATPase subunit
MYSSVTIQRFRCFGKLTVSGLRQVNLVTGVNNAGKTSLLEALFLLVGGFNPALPLRVNSFRGLESLVNNPEEQWGWLFHNHDVSQDITINATDTTGGEDALRVHLGGTREFERITKGQRELPIEVSGTLSPGPQTAVVQSTQLPTELSDLILEFREHRGRTVVSRVSMANDGRLRLEQSKPNGFRPGAFQATRIRTAAEDAERLSRLKLQRRDSEIVKVLQAIEPTLQDLTILVRGGESIIHAEIKGVGLVPLPMLGEGVGRLLSLTLAIFAAPGGLVLVDEIENGIHHSALRGVWKGLASAAREAGAQVIATTHSQECIAAAHATFAANGDYDLSIIQLFRLPTGIEARTLDKRLVGAAMAGDIDLR